MMTRTMRKWFHFDGSDAKTAEAWLNRLGAACWGLAALAWLVLWLGAGGAGMAGAVAGGLARMAGRLVEACIPPCPVIG